MSDQTTTTDPEPTPEPATGSGDWATVFEGKSPEQVKAELDKWKHFSRQNEDKFKEVNSELEKIRQANLSDAERAIEEAKAAGRAEAESQFEAERLQLKLAKAAADAGVPDEVLNLVDPSKLVVNGEVQTELLSSLAQPQKPQFTKSASELGLGAQTNPAAGQWTREQLARAKAEGDWSAINQARKEGKLNDVMTGGRSQ